MRNDTGRSSIFRTFTWLVSGRAGIRICLQNLHLPTSYAASQGWGLTSGLSLLSAQRGPWGDTGFSWWEGLRQNRRCRSELAWGQSSSWEACPVLPALVHKSSGRCPRPHVHCWQLIPSPHPRWCYAIGTTKERHREAKNDAIERKGEHGAFYLLPWIGSSYPALLSSGRGPPERNNRLTRNNLSKQLPWRINPHEVQP